MPLPDNQTDWEVTPDGLFVATRHFLVRRGYCCANRCLNCPYVNWREQRLWQHAPEEALRRVTVSPKVLSGVRAQVVRHQRAIEQDGEDEYIYHLEMLEHYRRLLELWR